MARQSRDTGFSLVELMVAMTFMAIIATGIIPFMVRSTRSNLTSYETSNVTNLARNTVERYFQADFNDTLVTLASGNSLVVNEYFSRKENLWKAMPIESGDFAKWKREITVRQFAISAIDDGVLEAGEALEAGALASVVALKQVEVYVESVSLMRAGAGPNRHITLTLVKSR